MEFPKVKHHSLLSSRMVNDPDEEAALGPEWTDHRQQTGAPKPPCEHCAAVEEELVRRTVQFNAAWGEIEAHRDALQAEVHSLRAAQAPAAEKSKPKPAGSK